MAKKQAQSSSLLVTLGGPAALLCVYGAYMQINPSEAAVQIERLESDVERLHASAISEERRTKVSEDLREKQEQLDGVKNELDGVRLQAADLMRGEVDGVQQLELGGEINRVLKSAGLRLVDEHPVTKLESPTSMLGTLMDATEELGKTLTELSSEEAEDSTNFSMELPDNFDDLGLTPTQWMAQQRSLRVDKFDGPKTRSSELRLVGDYRSMVAGLEAVIDTCPGVVVSSVSFRKPPMRINGGTPLIWNLQLQMRPSGAGSGNDADIEAGGESFAVRPSGPSFVFSSAAREGQTYTVAKPVLEGAD